MLTTALVNAWYTQQCRQEGLAHQSYPEEVFSYRRGLGHDACNRQRGEVGNPRESGGPEFCNESAFLGLVQMVAEALETAAL